MISLTGTCYTRWAELVEDAIAEGVREHHVHLGTILNRFIFEKKTYIYMRHASFLWI